MATAACHPAKAVRDSYAAPALPPPATRRPLPHPGRRSPSPPPGRKPPTLAAP